MPWDGSGNATRTNGTHTGSTLWTKDKNASTKIVSNRHDTHDQDVVDMIDNCLTKDGQNAATANIDFGGFEIENCANLAGTVATFTPVLAESSGNYTVSAYTTQLGRKFTIGDLVFYFVVIEVQTASGTPSGGATWHVTGLPDTSASISNFAYAGTVCDYSAITITQWLACQIDPNDTKIQIYDGTGQLTGDVVSTPRIVLSGMYEKA